MKWTALLLGLAMAAVYQFGVPLRATYGARVNVDEPFYLLAGVSLLSDGDLDLANDYAERRYRAFFDHPDELWYQSAPLADGRVLSPHNPGLSVLIAPAYALGGVDGVKRFLAVLGGATVAMTALLAFRATGHAAASLLSAAAIGAAAPMFVYATQIYPELPAALLVTACAYVALGRRPGWLAALGLVLGLSGLVWLGTKYVVVGVVLGAFGLSRLTPAGRVVLCVAGVVSAMAYVAFHLATYSELTPYSVNVVYAGLGTRDLLGAHFEFGNRLYRLIGLWVDAEFGLIRWAPLLLVALPGVLPMLRRRGQMGWSLAAVFVAQLLVAVFLSITMRGWWFPGRMLVIVLPLLAVPMAIAIASAGPRVRAVHSLLGAWTVITTAALVSAASAGQVALAVDPFAMSWPVWQALAPIFPLYTSYSTTTWLLSALWLLIFALLILEPHRIRRPVRSLRAQPAS